MTKLNFPVDHPGVYIGEEIEARGWNQADLAFILGVPPRTVSLLISGKRGISAAMAKSLGDAFGVSAELFLGLQKEFELSQAKDPDQGVSSRARVQDYYPLREMIRRKWIENAEPNLLEEQVARFFEVDSFDEVPYLSYAAKKSSYADIPPTQLAWAFRVRQIAKETAVGSYRPEILRQALDLLSAMRESPEEIRHVPRVLAECGVRFVIVESLPGAGIDGACLWLRKDAPVIGMTLRYDRIDNFWFVLRHEIEHVLNCDAQEVMIIDSEETVDPTASDLPEQELRANQAAASFCVPTREMHSFYLRKNPYFSRRAVKAFARRIHVHPGLVVGQLQYRTKKWDLMRDFQVKVRHYICSSMLVDGWGDVIPTEL